MSQNRLSSWNIIILVLDNRDRVAPPVPPLPGERVLGPGKDVVRGIEAQVAPRSQTPGGGGDAGQATAPAGGEATGALTGQWGGDYQGGNWGLGNVQGKVDCGVRDKNGLLWTSQGLQAGFLFGT